MKQEKTFVGRHEDFVHDVVYDHYGKRMATCGSDHKIKVWSENASGNWQCEAELLGHTGAVWKLAWAHPEFGQVLASCSFDKQVIIWEEVDTPVSNAAGLESDVAQDNRAGGAGNSTQMLSRWQKATSLKGDGRETVNDMQFAPRQMGLSLATCSSDGMIRIYEADDVMNLENWSRSQSFAATNERDGATCLSWNTSRFDVPMLVVGGKGFVCLLVLDSTTRRWQHVVNMPMVNSNFAVNDVAWAPNMGRSYHLIAAAVSNRQPLEVWRVKMDPNTKAYTDVKREAELESDTEIWRCEWNVTGTALATAGDNGTIELWRKNFQNKWNTIARESLSS
mmetsp:Transcript_5985/g.10681  ORF Transcript_5985/g.10681 Transcript_5985/m.10681 type:complete len:336 (-) Transcript_5985:110-1117(-)|eukprot:CAMPEP_0184511024 /NCGR_PEP_ID=MMETSP0198_2-20121128/2126_1 /TAXON_ID=1112570 /ORGANISM="Thraustochytrium sp., Strain LLF1b" /LENGTH=335 /DNA_ID=CAMNT_0026900953 /DNA_START=116 /DNA_END=1123 /DNA_ORIENTATION=+